MRSQEFILRTYFLFSSFFLLLLFRVLKTPSGVQDALTGVYPKDVFPFFFFFSSFTVSSFKNTIRCAESFFVFSYNVVIFTVVSVSTINSIYPYKEDLTLYGDVENNPGPDDRKSKPGIFVVVEDNKFWRNFVSPKSWKEYIKKLKKRPVFKKCYSDAEVEAFAKATLSQKSQNKKIIDKYPADFIQNFEVAPPPSLASWPSLKETYSISAPIDPLPQLDRAQQRRVIPFWSESSETDDIFAENNQLELLTFFPSVTKSFPNLLLFLVNNFP
ncbi:hypothetical protein GEMRC1_012877 [Eukaryota sp. GEM-RC1]